MKSFELKVPPLIVLAVFALTMPTLPRLIPSGSFQVPGSEIAAIGLILVGLAAVLAGIIAFRANKTTVDPRTPDLASTVVVGGVYRISRNPMYLGFLCMLAGWALYLSNAAAFMLLPAFFAYITAFQIKPEERLLHSKFGSRYAEYVASVPRWI